MAYDPADMLRLANYLLCTPVPSVRDETRWRAAIGRSYYACWLTARDRLWGIGGRPTGTQKRQLPRVSGREPGSHEQVIEALGCNPSLSSPAKRKRQKDALGTLKAMRHAADYKNSDADVPTLFAQFRISTWEKLAEQALVLSGELLPELATHPKFP